MEFLTVSQLKKACVDNQYLLVRLASGHQMGINCKVAPIALRKKEYKDEDKTGIVSFIPCDFNTYILFKHPFYTTTSK